MIKKYTRDTHWLVIKWNSWHLANKIDRSYKWKEPDIWIEYIFLSNEEIEECKKEGFDIIKVNNPV